MLSQKQYNRGKLFTFWPINLQISGGREAAVIVAAAAPAFETGSLTLMASCTLQDPPEKASLPSCPDGRARFAGGLGRGCSTPLGWPSSPHEASETAVAEGEAGATEFSIGSPMNVAVRFRFPILADEGEAVEERMTSCETRRRDELSLWSAVGLFSAKIS